MFRQWGNNIIASHIRDVRARVARVSDRAQPRERVRSAGGADGAQNGCERRRDRGERSPSPPPPSPPPPSPPPPSPPPPSMPPTEMVRALALLYEATGGDAWRNNDKWLSGEPCVDGWFGVHCCPQALPVLRGDDECAQRRAAPPATRAPSRAPRATSPPASSSRCCCRSTLPLSHRRGAEGDGVTLVGLGPWSRLVSSDGLHEQVRATIGGHDALPRFPGSRAVRRSGGGGGGNGDRGGGIGDGRSDGGKHDGADGASTWQLEAGQLISFASTTIRLSALVFEGHRFAVAPIGLGELFTSWVEPFRCLACSTERLRQRIWPPQRAFRFGALLSRRSTPTSRDGVE